MKIYLKHHCVQIFLKSWKQTDSVATMKSFELQERKKKTSEILLSNGKMKSYNTNRIPTTGIFLS